VTRSSIATTSGSESDRQISLLTTLPPTQTFSTKADSPGAGNRELR
jgi:hypothetical protein